MAAGMDKLCTNIGDPRDGEQAFGVDLRRQILRDELPIDRDTMGAQALSALADLHVLRGIATNDVAMMIEHMLVVCTACWNQSGAAIAVDYCQPWCRFSSRWCCACFSRQILWDELIERDTMGAQALSALADLHVLRGIATNDVAMMMEHMLAVCQACGKRSVTAIAVDYCQPWCRFSSRWCCACLPPIAIESHDAEFPLPPSKRFHRPGTRCCTPTFRIDENVGEQTAPEGTKLTVVDDDIADPPIPMSEALLGFYHVFQDGWVMLPMSISSGAYRAVLHARPREYRFPIEFVSFSPDSGTIASASSLDHIRRVCLTDIKSLRQSCVEHCQEISAVAFSPIGTIIAVGCGNGTAELCDTPSFDIRCVLRGHSRSVSAFAFSLDGATIATGSLDKTVRLWDTASGTCRHVLRGHTRAVLAVAYAPSGAIIASVSVSTLRIWDVTSGNCRFARPLFPMAKVVRSRMAPRPPRAIGDEQPDFATRAMGVTSSDDDDSTTDISGENAMPVLHHHEEAVTDVAFSPDGTTIATSSQDTTVRLWDVASLECRGVLVGHAAGVASLAFSPDSSFLVSGSDDGTARVWDVASGECRALLKGPAVCKVAYSPNGSTIAASCRDGTVRFWDAVLSCGSLDVAHSCTDLDGDTPPMLRDQAPAVRISMKDDMDMEDVTARVAEFYSVHNPDLVGAAATRIIGNYKARYSLLADALNCKYLGRLPQGDLVPSSPGFTALVGGLVYHKDTMSKELVAHELRVFLERHDAARLDDVPRLMKVYAGSYQALFDSFNAAAFDLPPVTSMACASVSRSQLQWPDLDIDESCTESLGKGAFGDVYRVYSRKLEAHVAMKSVEIKPPYSHDTIEREADAMREVMDCPQVVRVLSFERRPQHAMIYMELMPGGSLENIVGREGPQWEERCRPWVRDALMGLKRLHCVDLVHRDVKPSNILLGADGCAKLSDFGLTKDLDESVHSAGDPKGTMPYLAPELAVLPVGKENLKYASSCDVWSLGCTWLRLLTGKDPWFGIIATSDDLPAVARIIGIANVLGYSTCIPNIPDWLSAEAQQLLKSMLSRDPAKRIVVEGVLQSEYFKRDAPPEDCEAHAEFVARCEEEHLRAEREAAEQQTPDEETFESGDGSAG